MKAWDWKDASRRYYSDLEDKKKRRLLLNKFKNKIFFPPEVWNIIMLYFKSGKDVLNVVLAFDRNLYDYVVYSDGYMLKNVIFKAYMNHEYEKGVKNLAMVAKSVVVQILYKSIYRSHKELMSYFNKDSEVKYVCVSCKSHTNVHERDEMYKYRDNGIILCFTCCGMTICSECGHACDIEETDGEGRCKDCCPVCDGCGCDVRKGYNWCRDCRRELRFCVRCNIKIVETECARCSTCS